MKAWIEQLHIGQLAILLVALLVFGSGAALAGAVLADNARVEATASAVRQYTQAENVVRHPLGQRIPADLYEEFQQQQRERQLALQEIRQQARRPYDRLVVASLGLIPLAFAAVLAILWVWFGGRKSKGAPA